MKTLQALREKIVHLSNQANKLLADKGEQIWAAEDQAQFDSYANEITQAKNQIKAIELMREHDADKFFNATPEKKEDGVTLDALAAVALYLRNGNVNVSAEHALAIRNAMSTTTTTEGGYTVPAVVAAMVIDKLKAFGGMRDVATLLTTDGGNLINWPTSDGTNDVGEIVGQNAQANTGDITFGTVPMNVFYYTSKAIALPKELIQDSAIDVIAYVVDRLATRIARIQNTHFTVGTGTTLPDGVIPKSGIGKTGTTGQTTSVIYDDLIDLIHSVNRAYRSNGRFMLNDLSLATIRKIKDTTGRPIWTPGEETITDGIPATICGYAYSINDDMAVMAASAKSIAFGDFKKYTIRDVSNSAQILRFDDSAFALKNQVGFCGWQRSGGQLLDTAAVKVYVNSAS